MLLKTIFQKWTSLFGISLAGTLLLAPALHAQTELAVPKITEYSSDHGPALASQEVSITVHLKLRNEADFNKAIDALYTPGSPTYHQWLTKAELAKYSPSAADVETVKKELEAHGLSVLSVDSNNFSIRARGTVSNVEYAFQTQIHEFEREGKTFHANIAAARLTGPAGDQVDSVSGLSSFALKSMIRHPVDLRTGKRIAGTPTPKHDATGFLATYFTNNCFKAPAPVSLTTDGAALPVGVYFGNIYDQGSIKSCGWTPAQVLQHYRLDPTDAPGLDGTGQTIVIVDGPSDPSVVDDFTAFSQAAGLPAPNSKNFELIYPDGKPSEQELDFVANWDDETTLDIEWAHGIAPKAKIVLLIVPTEDWPEFEFAIQYATENKLGNVISNSYGYPEFLWGPATLKAFDQVLKVSAASGVAVNFSSGDEGDEGTGAPNAGGASYPATSTYVTQIGGTSIGIPDGKADGFHTEVGWGTNQAVISFAQNFVLDPPEPEGYVFGSGGGESIFIPKPSWQKSLPGTGRQGPDISAVGDPFTGGVVFTGGYASPAGGTSLAAPIFSAIWALAMQKAGKPLGQAAPLIATLPKGAINDIVPLGSPTNPAGTVFDSDGPTFYSSALLITPGQNSPTYYAALWNYPDSGGEFIDVSFGTDTSLTVTKGWDNVTGWGVPDGVPFIDSVVRAK